MKDLYSETLEFINLNCLRTVDLCLYQNNLLKMKGYAESPLKRKKQNYQLKSKKEDELDCGLKLKKVSSQTGPNLTASVEINELKQRNANSIIFKFQKQLVSLKNNKHFRAKMAHHDDDDEGKIKVPSLFRHPSKCHFIEDYYEQHSAETKDDDFLSPSLGSLGDVSLTSSERARRSNELNWPDKFSPHKEKQDID